MTFGGLAKNDLSFGKPNSWDVRGVLSPGTKKVCARPSHRDVREPSSRHSRVGAEVGARLKRVRGLVSAPWQVALRLYRRVFPRPFEGDCRRFSDVVEGGWG